MVFLLFFAILGLFALQEMYSRRRRPAKDAARAAQNAERRDAERATTRHHTQVNAAREELEDAGRATKLGELEVESIDDATGDAVFLLHDTSIATPAARHDVTGQTHADVDDLEGILATGRDAAKRLGRDTVITGPVGDLLRDGARAGAPDATTCYLLVQGDAWADSVACARSQRQRATEFAEQVNRAAVDVDGVRERRERDVASLTERVVQITREAPQGAR